MSELTRIYAPGPMQPVVDIHENLAILTQGQWRAAEVVFIEGMPFGEPLKVDFGAVGTGARLAKAVATILQLDEFNLWHVRVQPIDYVNVQLWELGGQSRYWQKNVTAEITPTTAGRDPWLASSTFFIYGKDRDANFQVYNPTGYALTSSVVAFWGYRYLVRELQNTDGSLLSPEKAPPGMRFTWIPAEGMAVPYPTSRMVR